MSEYRLLESLFVLAMLVLLPSAALAKNLPTPVRPTIAFDAKARVMRGGDVEITLNAVPNYGNTIDFEIRTPPSHGSLSAPKNLSDHSAAVIYHHDGTKSPKEDEFTFRAKTLGRAASVVSKASIRIIPPAAQITFTPTALDFGNVLLSETRSTNVKVANIGGVRATGRLLLPRGFTAPEGDRFSLDEGESTVVALTYSPMEEGASSGSVTSLPALRQEVLELKGTGVPRFEIANVAPSSWEIKNSSGQPIRVNFSCANGIQGWQMPKETLIEPHGAKIVTFQQQESAEAVEGAELIGGMSGEVANQSPTVLVTDGLSTKEIKLPAPSRFIPLTLQSVTPERLPSAPIGCSIPVVFRLLNRSEYTKQVSWSAASQSGGGTTSANILELHPGEVKEIAYDWFPSLPGDAELKIIVKEGTRSPHELLWRAHILLGASSSTVKNDGEAAPVPSPELPQGDLEVAPSPVAESKPIPQIEEATWEVKSSWLGKQSVVLVWKCQEKTTPRTVLDKMILVQTQEADNSQQAIESSNLPAVKLEAVPLSGYQQSRNGDHQRITLPHFSPGWHLLRLSLYAEEDTVPPVPLASSQLQVRVPAKVPWWISLKIPLGLSATFLLLFFLRKHRRSA